MTSKTHILLSHHERDLILEALESMQLQLGSELSQPSNLRGVKELVEKIKRKKTYPEITVGIFGGQVQWIVGNPTPIRILDYDGDETELPHVDEKGQKCRIWMEPAS